MADQRRFTDQAVAGGDAAARIRGYFSVIAPRYDFMNTLLSAGLHHVWKRAAVRAAGIRDDDVVLDVCGGTGDLAALAARRLGPRGRAVVYDYSLPMLAAGLRKRRNTGRAAVCGDAARIAVSDNSCDVVLIGFGLRNIVDRPAALQEMRRVLRPGGCMVCLEFSQPAGRLVRCAYDWYSYALMPWLGRALTGSSQAYTYLADSIRAFPDPAELAALFRAAGFQDVGFRLIAGGIAAIHTGRCPAAIASGQA